MLNIGEGRTAHVNGPTSADDVSAPAQAPLTFGERAVGLTFNPSNDPAVDKCKRGFAALIDQMHELREQGGSGDRQRHCSIAITELESAQMRAVKAITWRG